MLTFSLIIKSKPNTMTREKVYRFKNVPNLYADIHGNFFFKNYPVRKVYNNGTMAVRIGKTKLGIKKLRSLAYVSFAIKENLPF